MDDIVSYRLFNKLHKITSFWPRILRRRKLNLYIFTCLKINAMKIKLLFMVAFFAFCQVGAQFFEDFEGREFPDTAAWPRNLD